MIERALGSDEWDLVLASASPRRRALLEGAGLRVLVRPAEVQEIPHLGESPDGFALRMATDKVQAALNATSASGSPFYLASDTVVTVDGRILGKPRDAAEACEMLRSLAGRTHQVLTSWALAHRARGVLRCAVEAVTVTFRPLTDAEIEAYVATGEPMDKAGAYGIQGRAGLFVTGISGNYEAVVGLPLTQVCQALVEEGVVAGFPLGLAGRAAVIRGRMAAAARLAGRRPEDVLLVAVSKRQPASALREAFAAGIGHFGESYVQEWRDKAFQLGPGLVWHFVGRLQRNKARFLGGRVSLVHGLDDPRVVEALGKSAKAAGRVVGALVQVNLAGEASKGGVAPDQVSALLDVISAQEALTPAGLMVIPPDEGPAAARAQFAALRALRDSLATPARPLPELSMGMSDDYELAIAEGATLVRVGTALFGPRRTEVTQ